MCEAATFTSRYDTPGAKTLYLAGSAAAAFVEVLAPFRQKVSSIKSVSEDAKALGLNPQGYLDLIQEEWQEMGHLAAESLPASW